MASGVFRWCLRVLRRIMCDALRGIHGGVCLVLCVRGSDFRSQSAYGKLIRTPLVVGGAQREHTQVAGTLLLLQFELGLQLVDYLLVDLQLPLVHHYYLPLHQFPLVE